MPIDVPPSPPASSPGRSRNMAAIKRRDTQVERQLRSKLHSEGLRFRVDHPLRVGDGRAIRPDIVFTRARLAIFVDGCFWHGCPEHGRRDGGANPAYWGPKIARNVERDECQTKSLMAAGWRVVRIWEHEPLDVAVGLVGRALCVAEDWYTTEPRQHLKP